MAKYVCNLRKEEKRMFRKIPLKINEFHCIRHRMHVYWRKICKFHGAPRKAVAGVSINGVFMAEVSMAEVSMAWVPIAGLSLAT